MYIPCSKIPIEASAKEIQEIITAILSNTTSIPAEILAKEAIGKSGLMWPRTYSQHHPAVPLLSTYATKGCHVSCGKD